MASSSTTPALARLDDLRAEVASAEARLETATIVYRESEKDAADLEKYQAAQNAVQGSQHAVGRFLASHRVELAAELARAAGELQGRYEIARRQMVSLEDEWAELTAAWRPILEAFHLNPSELPESPARTNLRRRAELLVPTSLRPELELDEAA